MSNTISSKTASVTETVPNDETGLSQRQSSFIPRQFWPSFRSSSISIERSNNSVTSSILRAVLPGGQRTPLLGLWTSGRDSDSVTEETKLVNDSDSLSRCSSEDAFTVEQRMQLSTLQHMSLSFTNMHRLTALEFSYRSIPGHFTIWHDARILYREMRLSVKLLNNTTIHGEWHYAKVFLFNDHLAMDHQDTDPVPVWNGDQVQFKPVLVHYDLLAAEVVLSNENELTLLLKPPLPSSVNETDYVNGLILRTEEVKVWMTLIQRAIQQRALFVRKIPLSSITHCMRCRSLFQLFQRHKHHCRVCGFVVCDSCSQSRIVLVPFQKAVRSCADCERRLLCKIGP